jgi:hypothetical protein
VPRSVAEGFRDFLPKLTPSSLESAASTSHRTSIEACLKNNFTLIRLFRTGSFGNGTSISGFSDVDYFASLRGEGLLANSASTLQLVRNALDTRFPYTGVRVNCPAVMVPFGSYTSETTEVVPADCVQPRGSQKYLVYDIPDCAGGWMRASPDAHNDYVRTIDNSLGARVKPLIRFIRAWKFYRQVPLSSFYLELRVAKYAEGEQSISYEHDVLRVLRVLYNNNLAAMQDPMGISGLIQPCKTALMLDDARSKLLTSFTRAEKAFAASQRGDAREAFEYWRLLYNNAFPGYYQ